MYTSDVYNTLLEHVCLSVRHTLVEGAVVRELLRDGLEFPNAILQDGYR